MANYSIFTLGESQMTISGGGQLDGVTQGDGSHLVGLTITLNSNAWQEVQIRDGGSDTDFRDNDGNQRLDGNQTIDGVNYSDGQRIEAEYGLTLSDGVNVYQVVGVNVNNSNPSFATIEGLAFIGGPGGFPPVGVPLTVLGAQEGPNFDSTEYATPICFVRGTLIDTPSGPRPIESMKAGDRVWTETNQLSRVKWAGGRAAIAAGRFAPVEIPAGTLGANRPLRVSQQHRILITHPVAEILFGSVKVWIPATHLIGAGLAHLVPGGGVEYFHLLLDAHQAVRANGVETESLHIPNSANDTEEAVHFFPELAAVDPTPYRLAYPSLKRHEADLLFREIAKIDPNTSLRHSA
ncbi:Hint domain-containing protein [Tropicibacter sp. R16_0]|uniref:Hint domain-containing protein n=1 Tax=Tropicibacter sp. R16_0 TaxID=2821102 RepID=UPI001AD9DB81|nr:Hint domain-containing protein [Tropicibacter sp. R16_0]MBO9449146.1 Hint domain-containing protein [Tropicibacter sp. R16_0]